MKYYIKLTNFEVSYLPPHSFNYIADATLLEARASTTLPSASEGIGIGSLIGACITCFLLGIVVGGLAVHTYVVKTRQRQIPSSPHYLSVKPNQYVTVPGTHRKLSKNEKSMSPTATLKGTLKRQHSNRDPYTTLPLKDMDATATIKRSSHSSYGNGHLRADLDSDTIFNF